jgi:hypothetical protein
VRVLTSGSAIARRLHEVAPPFDPTSAVAQIATTLREYGLSEVTGDRYAAEWVVFAFASCDQDQSARRYPAGRSAGTAQLRHHAVHARRGEGVAGSVRGESTNTRTDARAEAGTIGGRLTSGGVD